MTDASTRIWAWPHFDGWITGDRCCVKLAREALDAAAIRALKDK